MASTTVQFRVDEKLKHDAGRVYEGAGMDTSSALKLFMQQSVLTQSIPLSQIVCKRQLSKKQVAEYDKESQWALKHAKRYTSAEKLISDILDK